MERETSEKKLRIKEGTAKLNDGIKKPCARDREIESDRINESTAVLNVGIKHVLQNRCLVCIALYGERNIREQIRINDGPAVTY
jgi:hypothetical protein